MDRGRRWRALALAGGADFHALSVQQGDGDVLVGFNAMAGELLRSLDGGTTWAPVGLLLGGGDAAGYVAPHPTDPATVYVGSLGMDVLTTDGGATWRHLAERGVPVPP